MNDFATPYEAGYDAGLNGPNINNCHFGIFSSPERTLDWERGKKDAEAGRPKEENEIYKHSAHLAH